jgi:hypothetical protein
MGRPRLGLYRVTDPLFPQYGACSSSDYESSYGNGVAVALGSAWVWGRDDALDLARDCAEAQDYDDDEDGKRTRQPYRVERVLLDEAREILAYFPDELEELGL